MGASVSIGYYNIFTILGPALMSIVIALILVLALSPMFALRVGRRFLKPFENMAEEIQAFGEENLNARMQDFDIQEFHDISVVFNGMADHIEYLITQVYEKQLLATESQVKFLQAQIQPHFQFNILAMLSVKAKLADNEELYQLTNAFSKLIQGKIFREKEIKITLADEMELVEFYLFLQKGRYNEKLNYSIYYGKDDVKECLIPRLLIEPLVENAVSHGLEPKSGVGHIDIQIFCQDGQLHVMVRDDGVGFEIGKVEQKNESEHTHTGIANTKRLLEILYKGNYQMHVDGQAGKGTCVEIILPEERICKSCGK
jgi:sensor histidine kinase YesM